MGDVARPGEPSFEDGHTGEYYGDKRHGGISTHIRTVACEGFPDKEQFPAGKERAPPSYSALQSARDASVFQISATMRFGPAGRWKSLLFFFSVG
jgi:hypothetical protein